MAGTNGYRVGSQCFSSKEAAVDQIMSQVVPVVTANGTLQHPVKHGAVWQYNGHLVELTLPKCDPSEDFEDGITVATYIVGLMFVAFVIKTAVRVFKLAGDSGSSEDQ